MAFETCALETLSKELAAQMQGANHVWLPQPAAETCSAFPSVCGCRVSASAAAQGLFSKCASPSFSEGHTLRSPPQPPLCWRAVMPEGRKRCPCHWDWLDGLAGQTVSVPTHAVDLLCDLQRIAYSRGVLCFSLKRPLILPDLAP